MTNTGQKLYNSNASDDAFVVWPKGVGVADSQVTLTPGGDSYTVKSSDVSTLRVVITGTQFRAKKDGGSWGNWQALPGGSKEFAPADSKTTYYQIEV